MNIMGKPPLGLKGAKADAPAKVRKQMPRKSKKRAAYHASTEGQIDLTYMGIVKTLPCAACGAPGPHDAHHCKDIPPFKMQWIYEILPDGVRSGATDTIPLCSHKCHNGGPDSYHKSPDNFNAKYGPDYLQILPTRAAVAAMQGEISF